ncbi:MAG: hypothetical protein V1781_09775 [Bacteroidota bacterium]
MEDKKLSNEFFVKVMYSFVCFFNPHQNVINNHLLRAVPKIGFVIATARHEAGSNLYFYIKKQIASVVPPSQ